MQTTQQNFDALIARNLSSHLSSRLTDDRAMQLSLLVPHSMSLAKQLRNLRDQTAVATVLISAVIRAGLMTA